MDSYSEVRRVRSQMSKAVGHDVRALIAGINKGRFRSASRIIDPGTKAEQYDARGAAGRVVTNGESSPAAR